MDLPRSKRRCEPVAGTAWAFFRPLYQWLLFKPEGRKAIAVANPANGDKLAEIICGNVDDVDQAVKAARAAFGKWSKLSGYDRAKYLYAIARHIQKRERFLAVLETMDNGKPIRETRDIDIPLAARHFYHHAGWAEMAEDEFKGFSPVGVCGQVIPWNFPLLMLAWKIAPALAAGNTVVLKPADLTPLSAIAFAEICHEVGLPAGVINIVQGDGTTGAEICGHDGVDKVAFTGSTQVGRVIREQIAGSGKKLSLELGGKSPFIVFEDADLDAAVEGVVDAIWFNQGEVCCAGSRLLVQEGIADRFYAKLRKRLESLRVGDPLDKSSDVGAIVSAGQVKRISDLIQKASRKAASSGRRRTRCQQRAIISPPASSPMWIRPQPSVRWKSSGRLRQQQPSALRTRPSRSPIIRATGWPRRSGRKISMLRSILQRA